MNLRALLPVLALCSGIVGQSPAATGDFIVYANGCPGSGSGLGLAFGLNESATTIQAGSSANQLALKAYNAGPTVVSVRGFELWTTSVSTNPVTLTTELYDESATGGPPNLTPIRTGTMVVGTRPAFYRTTFAQSYLLGPGAALFLSFTGTAAVLKPRLGTGGALGEHYWRPPLQTAWNGPLMTEPWAWRVLTAVAPGARPLIGSSGIPSVGSFFTIKLAEARTPAAAALGLGGSSASWSGLVLPLDLAPFGMPGCSAHASVEVSYSTATDANGNSFFPIVIPNDASLRGGIVYSQWWVLDPGANGAGIVNSDAAEVRIG